MTPARPGSHHGNRVTAVRWAAMLEARGHAVSIAEGWDSGNADLLLALHARRSHRSIEAYAQAHPRRPIVVALTGTDVYGDLEDAAARRSLELATRLVVLQRCALVELRTVDAARARVVIQSAEPIERRGLDTNSAQALEVAVVGHLREEKDPLRAALAAERLPTGSRIRVVHAGSTLDKALGEQARVLERAGGRYRWLGELEPAGVRALLSRAWLLVHSSRLEGGANVLSEALAASLPIVASRIPGNVGVLGADHPGYFPTGDEQTLADLLAELERDPSRYAELERASAELAPLVAPERERAALGAVVDEAAAAA